VPQSLRVCQVGEIPEGESVVITVQNKGVAVFCHEGKYFAIDDLCPHAGASLSSGYVEEGVVTCPWHGWRFRLSDGAWADNPKVKTGCYAVQVVNNEVHVQVPDSKG
jgi:nitrite reductase (NADH) small subunit